MSTAIAITLALTLKISGLIAIGFLLGLGFWTCKQVTNYIEEAVSVYKETKLRRPHYSP